MAFGCKKAPDRTCLKKTGSSVTETTYLDGLSLISVYDDVNVVLIQDSVNYIEVASYENIINHIVTRFENNNLEIRNNNKCRFLRNYDKQTTVKIHITALDKLELYGKGNIETENTIVNNRFHIYTHSSNSNLNLNVSSNNLTIEFVNGTLDGNIKGFGKETYIFHSGYSNVNFIGLETEILNVINKSYSSTYVNATTSLTAKIENTGNIYYKGNPTIEKTTILSSGLLLKHTE